METTTHKVTCYVQNEVVVVSDGAFQFCQILQNLLTLFRLQIGQEILEEIVLAHQRGRPMSRSLIEILVPHQNTKHLRSWIKE